MAVDASKQDAMDKLGRSIDTLDNLIAATSLRMPAEFHLKQLRNQLPDLSEDMKDAYVEITGEDPWEFHPDRRRGGAAGERG